MIAAIAIRSRSSQVSGDGKRARVAGYVCGEIDLRFFLVVRNVESERCTDSNKRPRDGSVVAKGARDKRMMMLYKERGRGRLSVLIETGEERVLSPSASHTQKQQNRKDAVASLTHTVAAQSSRSIIVHLPRLSPSHVSQRNSTLSCS